MIPNLLNFYKDSFSGLKREIWILSFITLINRAGSMVIPFLSLYLTQERGFDLTTAGLILSSYGIGSIAGNYLGGLITDRLGCVRVMQTSLILTAVCFMVLYQMHTVLELCVLIIITAICADSFRPASMSAVGQYSDSENRSRAIGLVRLAINVGFTLGPAVAGWLALRYSYAFIFYVDALTCLLAFLMVYVFFPSTTVENSTEPDVVQSARQSILRDRPFLLFTICCFFTSVLFMQMFYALPVYLHDVGGLTESDIGILLGFNGFIIVILEMPLLHALRSSKRIIPLIALGILAIGLSYGTLVITESLLIFYIMMFILTVGEMLAFPLSSTWTLNRATSKNRGKYMGIYGIAFSISHIVAPSIGLYIAETFNWTAFWSLITIIAIANAGFLFFVVRE